MAAGLFKRLALGGFFALAVLYACSDSTDVSSPGHGARAARVGFAPRYAYMGCSSFIGYPINRIRLTAVNQANNAVRMPPMCM